MLSYAAKRLGLAIVVALAVSLLGFGMIYLSGDVAVILAGEGASFQDIERARHSYGLDLPVTVQYGRWLLHALSGDFGQSLYYKRPVSELIAQRLPVTFILGGLSAVFAIVLGLPLGVMAAFRRGTWVDRAVLAVALFGQALPSFWFALMLVVTFALLIPILPASGAESWDGFVLPTIALGYFVAPAIIRLTRAGMIDVLDSDYIRTARAKGAGEMRVLWRHALRNAVIPVVSLVAVQLGFMLGGSIVVESVFALQGLGFLAWEAVKASDLPTIQAILLLFSVLYIVLNLLADLFNAWLDPRLRAGLS